MVGERSHMQQAETTEVAEFSGRLLKSEVKESLIQQGSLWPHAGHAKLQIPVFRAGSGLQGTLVDAAG